MVDIRKCADSVKNSAKKLAFAASGGVATALMALGASAADDSTVAGVVTSMGTKLQGFADDVATGATTIVGVGLTVFGIKFAVRKLKSFFTAVS